MIFEKKRLPIGVEDFEEIVTEEYYYIDKTNLIRDLLYSGGKVNLFTRPRRFGKSLNMSMLEKFFSIEGQKGIFDGLAISRERDLCRKYLGRFPVISVSLKGIGANSYETAFQLAVQVVREAIMKQQHLLESDRLTELDKESYRRLAEGEMNEAAFAGSLRGLSVLLEKHYGAKAVLLIDEYDVPLAKAYEQGYYDQMVMLLRNLFEQALKTNGSLQMAVLTGCMRISKESIFTGLNNLHVLSVADVRFDEYFGFTDDEVRGLLNYYECSESYEAVKEWYDGYRFGNIEVYCPWDVLNYCSALLADPAAQPQNYWINTSSNDAVRKFIQCSDNGTTRREIERLVSGECITKEIRQELTYRDMYASVENIWSVLLTTGYLTQRGREDGTRLRLAIPNREIRNIFEIQIMDLFKENVMADGRMLSRFCDALQTGDAQTVERELGDYLKKTISIRDTQERSQRKESFYHGILIGILGVKNRWIVSSNRESGDGYSDILVETEDGQTGIIIEVKYAEKGNLESACQKALDQIDRMNYEETLRDDGVEHILKYGIAFYKKRCRVKKK